MRFPNFPLADGPFSSQARDVGCADFHAAVRWVHALRYGRNADRADFTLVVAEQRGTCSTKHAFLAALARENGVRVALRSGIYLMNDANTPGVGATLRAHGLTAVAPEDIGAAKLAWHRGFIDTWARAEHLDPLAVWAAREACIAALAT